MKTLLWKEYRQNRQLVITAIVFLFLPYVMVSAIALIALVRYGVLEEGTWSHNLSVASFVGMAMATLFCAFIGGNAVAGERVDRSAEFVAYLPISRRWHISAKLILAVTTCATMLLVHHVVYLMAGSSSEPGQLPPVAMWVTAVLIFGVSWGVSAVVSRPATAAVSGLATVIWLFIVLGVVEELLPADSEPSPMLYVWSCLVLGGGCLAGGVAYYLRRVEP